MVFSTLAVVAALVVLVVLDARGRGEHVTPWRVGRAFLVLALVIVGVYLAMMAWIAIGTWLDT